MADRGDKLDLDETQSPVEPLSVSTQRREVAAATTSRQLRLQGQRRGYAFEGPGTVHRDTAAALKELSTLKSNIAMPDHDDRYDVNLTNLIIAHHLNIVWYDKRIKKERRLRVTFIGASLVLLVLIPVVTFYASKNLSGASSPAIVAVQLTALLTGIIGVQNALRGILEKRNLLGIFHKASAALKKAVFEFERQWTGCVPAKDAGDAASERFRVSIDDFTRRARDIESKEEEQYFDAISAIPLPDLRTAVSEAGQAAAGITSRFGFPTARSARAAVAVDTRVLEEKVTTLRAKLGTLESNLARVVKPEQGILIERSIVETREQLRDAEEALLAAIIRGFDAP